MSRVQPPVHRQCRLLLSVFWMAWWLTTSGLFSFCVSAQSDIPGASPETPVITSIAELRSAAAAKGAALWKVRIPGTVLWVGPALDELILQDGSSGVAVKMDLRNEPDLEPGQSVMVEGTCRVENENQMSAAVVDNDGTHSSTERSATVYLDAGLHPLTLEWFNDYGDFFLALDYAGPGFGREPVPPVALSRKTLPSAGSNAVLVPGLNYADYEGSWNQLPNFSSLAAVKSGVSTNFNLGVRSRDNFVGLQFTGYFSAPRDGMYTFWLRSDDGSKLFLGQPLRLELLKKTGLPSARAFIPGQFSSEELELQWVQVEGSVTRVSEVFEGVNVELTFGAERVYLKMPAGSYDDLRSLLHARIKVSGIYQSAFSPDGQTVPSVLVPKLNDIVLETVDPTLWEHFSVTPLLNITAASSPKSPGELIRITGTVVSNAADGVTIIENGGVLTQLEAAGSPPPIGSRIEALGWRSRSAGDSLLKGCITRTVNFRTVLGAPGLPLLTDIMQIKSLSQSEAQRGYPIRIRGVVTAQVDDNFIIQDGTWSIFCYGGQYQGDAMPQIGEAWEVAGTSSAHFAPDILVLQARYLGPGIFPEPIRPTKEELINGSLDTQYIELQGVVTDVKTNIVTLLTREGEMEFQGLDQIDLNHLTNALIRLRGVFIPNRDMNLMLTPVAAPILLFNATASVDEPAPAGAFDLPLKHISDLLHFDARADALRRIKISGEVLHERNGEYFLTDGVAGARFELAEPVKLAVGDLVQVVGFPDVSGPSPVLREAQVQISAHAALPESQFLSDTNLFNSRLDATMVSVQARLIGLSKNRSETTLDLQSGRRSFVAVLANRDGMLPDIQPGSLLQLTGIYDLETGGRLAPGDFGSFLLLLNAPSDVRVLERPSWWTTRHMLIVVSVMLLILLGAMVWITQLRRQVDERSRQLTVEIKGREQAEYQRAIEAERTRIAQDLHDDLGATLTEIRFFGAVKSRESSTVDDLRFFLKEISEKSRHMVSSLDEIVWAVNPANDSLPSLANYLCHVAEEFFRAANLRCRVDVADPLPPLPLTSEVRHSLYLVVREALNNVAKHSGATEVWLRIRCEQKRLQIQIEDNGRGFERGAATGAGNGLSNMASRLNKIGGGFECDTAPGRGTICRIELLLT